MGNPTRLHGILEGLTDVLLANQVAEGLWAVFKGKNLVRHFVDLG